MTLFRNSNYTDTYPGGSVSLQVGSPMYVGVTVERRDPDLVVVLEDCYATNTPYPSDYMKQFLIQNK